MYVITYLYSPNLESLEELQMKQTRKEHDQIMKQFYESELTDIAAGEKETDETLGERDGDSSREIIKHKGNGMNSSVEKRRREMKKDPMEKAKQKIWDSIIKEQDGEEEQESSEDEEHEI
mmetsp:Transcript_10744/g.10865  ORF Transcript_10744/g.10865 Transcript_10744/m.10865 type:complete len:120 (+) Transcript_10744:955-1314(+)